jgi:PAS domain S-box-containing protein
MNSPAPSDRKWNERPNASEGLLADTQSMFQLLFERSADAIVLFDPQAGVFVDCNAAALALLRAASKEQLLNASPADLSPPFQADGRLSREKSVEITALVQKNGSHRFEWLARRFDGTDVPLECLATAVPVGERTLHVVVPRDISKRKRAEEEIRQLNQTLEQRVAERTAELRASEAQFRTLVEHAPEAIVVFDGMSGRFEMVNEHAVRLFGRSREELLQLTPADVSPPQQPDGRPSAEAAREKMNAALAGEMPVFEWLHRHASGRLFASEVRLVRLPGERCCLLRASIIDHTERKRRQQVQRATYEISEAVHAVRDLASLYARIHSIVGGLMPAKNFYLALFDAASEMISFPYFVDEQADEWPAPRPVGTGLTGVVLRTGRPLLVTQSMARNARRVGDEVWLDGVELPYVEAGTQAAVWLGAPLMAQGRAFGVMAVQDYRDESSYGEAEKQLLTFVAAQTALAIERKRAEQALRESEQKFRALFEATSTGVMIHDEHQYLEVNPAIVRMFGYKSAADLVGKNPIVTSPPVQPGGVPTIELAQRHIAECLKNGTARFDWLARRADGTEFPVEVYLTRIVMGGRRLMQAVVNDISERKRAEAELRESAERLRESEARFSAAFRSSPVCMTITRMSDGRWVEANDTFLAWSGFSRDEVLGLDSRELNLWIHPEARVQFWTDLRATGAVRGRECEIRTRRSPINTVLLSAEVIEINREPHALLAAVDITERKRAEAELLKALAREQELGQLKSSFVSMVSHEFRTPLGVIQSSAEILRDYLDQLDAGEQQEHLQSIARNTRRMADMMEEVLLLGRLDAGKMQFEPAPIPLPRLCARLVDEVQSATSRACPIELRVGELPAGARADERLLRHSFTNLLTNAVKYSEPGRPVQFTVERDGRDAVFTVRDHGIGIPEPDQAWLFNAFHRGSNVGARAGTGLGLVIVKRCVELHDGRIRVESKVGEGTTVTVRLPVFTEGANP